MAKKPTKETTSRMTLMSGDEPFELKFRDLLDIVAVIIKGGQFDSLRARAISEELTVLVPVETVNSVKKFVAANEDLAADPIGVKVLSAPPNGTVQPMSMAKTVGCCGFSSDG